MDGIHGSELIEREVRAVISKHASATATATARGGGSNGGFGGSGGGSGGGGGGGGGGDRDEEPPLFLYVASQAPHAGYTGAPEWAYNQVDAMPSAAEFSEGRREVAALVSCLERLVKTTITAIQEGGLEDDTVVIFVSDNG